MYNTLLTVMVGDGAVNISVRSLWLDHYDLQPTAGHLTAAPKTRPGTGGFTAQVNEWRTFLPVGSFHVTVTLQNVFAAITAVK